MDLRIINEFGGAAGLLVALAFYLHLSKNYISKKSFYKVMSQLEQRLKEEKEQQAAKCNMHDEYRAKSDAKLASIETKVDMVISSLNELRSQFMKVLTSGREEIYEFNRSKNKRT